MINYMIITAVSFSVIVTTFVFYYITKQKNTYLEIEKENKLIYSENRCGAAFEYLQLTYPFVRISIYSEFLVISHFKKIILDFNEIKEIKLLNKFFSNGIDIIHTNRNVSSIKIWSNTAETLKNNLDKYIQIYKNAQQNENE